MKKRLLALTLAAASTIAVIASSCGTTTTASSGSAASAAPAAKTIVKVVKWGDGTDNTKDTAYQLVQKYNSSNTDNIIVKLDIVPGDGYGTKLTTSFASGSGYDVFESGEGDFYKWVAQGVNQPLDSYIASDTSFNKDDYQASIYNMGNINTKQYYLIKDVNPLILYYNTKMFDDAKIAYPTNSSTWTEVLADAKKLTNASTKTFGFNAQTWDYAFGTYLESNGGALCDATASTADGFMNSPATVKIVSDYMDFSKPGATQISPTAAQITSAGSPEAMMAANKLGLFISGYWSASSLATSKATYGTTVIPAGTTGKGVSWLCAAGYCMSSNTKVGAAAYKVIQALTNTAAQQAYQDSGDSALPTVKSILDTKAASMPASDKAAIDQFATCVQPIGLRGQNGNGIMVNFDKAITQIQQGQGTVQADLDAAAKAPTSSK